MSVRSIVTYVDPETVDQAPAALSMALDWAGAMNARIMVLAFPIEVGGADSPEGSTFAQTRAAIAALADRAGVSVSVIDRSSFAYGIGEVFADHLKVADLGIL